MSRIDVALRDLRTLESLAARDTPLARIDPRAKLVTTLVFLVAVVSFDRYAVAALLPLALYPVALLALGDVPPGAILRKLAVAAPFAALVGIANPWLDRAPVEAFGAWPVAGGWLSFASILLRFALTVSAALALVAGTGIHAIGAALARLGAPPVFVAQLLFLFRYAFVIGEQAARMGTARTLRANGRALALREYGPLAGHLLLRAYERAQRVHWAMRARGDDGRLRTLRPMRWTARDTRFLLGWCAFFALARAVDLPALLGQALLGLAG